MFNGHFIVQVWNGGLHWVLSSNKTHPPLQFIDIYLQIFVQCWEPIRGCDTAHKSVALIISKF